MGDVPSRFIHNRRRRAEGDERRAQFLELVNSGLLIGEACEQMGMSPSTYSKWRTRYPEFRAAADVARGRQPTTKGWGRGFAAFREHYFGFTTPVHHQLAVEAYETTPLGNITLILWPPEFGKTTLFEDFASYKLAIDPTFRFTVGSERQQGMSRKILARVKQRMSTGGPARDYLRDFGPFEPQSGAKVAQPWGADAFTVFKRGDFDERDYSMVALGINSGIAGTRTDHLHVDDVQSLKTKTSPEEILGVFRQDWLSRPGEEGRTTLNGTRVDEGDFYELLVDALGDSGILKVIRFPAIIVDHTPDGPVRRSLWPEKWPLDKLDRMRVKVGEEAWARNYMQQPRSKKAKVFTAQLVGSTLNPLRSISHLFERGTVGICTLDPAIGPGRNGTMTLAFNGPKLTVAHLADSNERSNNEEVLAQLEDEILFARSKGITITDVVIETMAFQKGLETDQYLKRMQRRYGFSIQPHMTGLNKYDESIGVPSMARDMRLGRIEIPYFDDEATRILADQLKGQLLAWKPGKKGTELRQDLVMCLWFGHILWGRRGGSDNDLDMPTNDQWSGAGLASPLVVPTGRTDALALGGRR